MRKETFKTNVSPKRILGVRPDLSHVEGVEAAVGCLLEAHNLYKSDERWGTRDGGQGMGDGNSQSNYQHP